MVVCIGEMWYTFRGEFCLRERAKCPGADYTKGISETERCANLDGVHTATCSVATPIVTYGDSFGKSVYSYEGDSIR